MTGSFSGHLIDSFLSTPQFSRLPFGQISPSSPHVAIHGPMSFAPQMHGTFKSEQSLPHDSYFMELSQDSAQKIATLQAKLNKKLGPEYISQRPGPGGGPKLTYAEGWKIINLANEVFGFNGWSSSVMNLTTDFIDQSEETKRYTVGVTAIVRVTLRDGAFHEDVGYGMLENSKSKGAALDKCKKEAVTDAVKRTLRNFGNLLGNCLYDKSYTQEVIKIKVAPPKFDKNELHRRPEFEGSKANQSSTTTNKVMPSPGPSIKPEQPDVKPAVLPTVQQPKVLSAVPPHVRSTSGPAVGPSAMSTPNNKGRSPVLAGATGLNTPVHTPASARGGQTNASGQQQQQRPLQQQHHNQKVSESSAVQGQIQLPQRERKVTFAPPSAAGLSASTSALPQAPATPAKDDALDDLYDDSFPLNSEDDAFLAALDLGEDGVGGPIDFEEGLGGVTSITKEDESEAGNGEQQQHQQHRPPQQKHYTPLQHQEHSERRLPRSRSPPQQSHLTRPHQIRVNTASAANSKQNLSHNANQNISPPPHLNLQPNPPLGASGTSARGRPSPSPSVGGFHFPPGVDPHNFQPGRPPGPTSRLQPDLASGNSGIGLKRSAEVMQAQSGAFACRPVQGMGLAPHSNGSGRPGQQSSGEVKREPFAALELGEGGDVKRVRR
ncbi:hypothetical protein AcV7_002675 [Taiwanofungus camphoratus]|nr:hypothetical protein AcV7_002675 [Antrodia cinnamomea]